MLDIGGLIKIFILSILLVIGLQVRVGNNSIEGHIISWTHSSSVVGTVDQVATGGVLVVKNFQNWIQNLFQAQNHQGHSGQKSYFFKGAHKQSANESHFNSEKNEPEAVSDDRE